MARPRNSDARRAQIVAALRVVMARNGYDGASVVAIAAEAGLAPGLVHYHFGAKQQVLLALVDTLAEGLTARLDARLTTARSPWHRLDAWIDAHLAVASDADPDAVACWVAIGAEAVRLPEVQAAYEHAVTIDLDRGEELVAAVLREGFGADATSPARLVAIGLLAAIEGSFRLAMGAPNAVPPGFAAPAVRAMARGLLPSARAIR